MHGLRVQIPVHDHYSWFFFVFSEVFLRVNRVNILVQSAHHSSAAEPVPTIKLPFPLFDSNSSVHNRSRIFRSFLNDINYHGGSQNSVNRERRQRTCSSLEIKSLATRYKAQHQD